MGDYQTFIVRLWTDASEDAVRGHIQHIATRRGVYFRDADRMLQFIREHLEPATLPVAAGACADDAGETAGSGAAEGGGADDR